MKVWIDNDGCPKVVKELVLSGCERKKVHVVVVANTFSNQTNKPLVEIVTVKEGFDAADDYIAENVSKGDLVITSDIPLAARIVEKGATGVSSHGQEFNAKNIFELLSTRNLLQELRGGGLVTGGPAPFGAAQKRILPIALIVYLRSLVAKGGRMNYDKNLDEAVKSAEKIAKDPAAVEILADKANSKARKAEKNLKGLKKELDILVRLTRAWATGKYKDVSWSSIMVIVGAVVYFVNPFDAIPDFLPLIGLTDDLSVVGFAVLRVRRELDKFQDWEKEITVSSTSSPK